MVGWAQARREGRAEAEKEAFAGGVGRVPLKGAEVEVAVVGVGEEGFPGGLG